MDESGMKYQDLVDAMEHAGAPLSKPTITRIFQGQRRIHVNELTALAEVFDVPLLQLLEPTERHLSREVEALIEELDGRLRAYRFEASKVEETIRRLALTLAEADEVTQRLVRAATRHETAVYELVDLALEVEDRLLDRARTAALRPRNETRRLSRGAAGPGSE
ncbi:hypothetical protein ACOCJ5_03265 [Knoellia sp. CPCC 206450]|uniref:hypothetical protein n=1 Tax=Knoellia tibetensis TaxID=3404798 RepID=UPI003B42FDDB